MLLRFLILLILFLIFNPGASSFKSMDIPDRISRITVEDLLDESKFKRVEQYIKTGKPEQVSFKLFFFRNHLHDMLTNYVSIDYDFRYSNDIDANVFLDSGTCLTPDLFDPETRRWGDVSISSDILTTVYEKVKKYQPLFMYDFDSLNIFVYDVVKANFVVYVVPEKVNLSVFSVSDLDPPQVLYIDTDFEQAILSGLRLYESSEQFLRHSCPPKKKIEFEEVSLCSEAIELSKSDNGFLLNLLDNNSFDSEDSARDKFIRVREKKLNSIAKSIALSSNKTVSPFEETNVESIQEAYSSCELSVSKNYKILAEPKTSCHGLQSKIEKIKPGVSDTRDYVIQKFKMELKESRQQIFQEILSLINLHETVTYPERKKTIAFLKIQVENHLRPAKQVEADVKKLESLSRMVKWDRNSLKTKRGSLLEKAMRIGKISKQIVDKVETVPFWEEDQCSNLKDYIYRKSNLRVTDDRCWTPHKEHKPRVKESGQLYYEFIHSELYQELAYVSQLSSNILRLSTKPRKKCSITTCANTNLLAIVGPGDGCMNEHSTIPLLWISLNSEESPLWSKVCHSTGLIKMTDGDRLTKNRLEQMVDAPRLASVAASICCFEMKGKPEDIMYACGVLSCVAMSINIRDSELIDHIRYLIPNIFSDRSCSAAYIREKYATALKTQLQTLIYQETKKTLLLSAKLVRINHEVEVENEEIISGGSTIKIPFLNCHVDSVFQLNGIVYTAFFSCKKGLHSTRIENKKMFDKICEYEFPNFENTLTEASFNESSPHYFDPEYIGYTMSAMVDQYGTRKGWRTNMKQMDNLKKPFEINTFSSLRSSLKAVNILPKIRVLTAKNKINSSKNKNRLDEISSCWDEIWSDSRTRVIDHFFDVDKTILEEGFRLLKQNQNAGFYSTWDQKRQRTGRDREVFILDPEGKVYMHNVESLFKVVCEGIPHELITLPGNKKIISMNMKGAQYFKCLKQKRKENAQTSDCQVQNTRMTMDMTKWAPGDNVCKFIYAIGGLNFLKRSEKVWYINFLCTSIRKKVIMNSVATEAIGAIIADKHLKPNEMWAKMLGIRTNTSTHCSVLEKNYVDVRFNWLMGVLNSTSSAVHAASASMLKRVLSVYYDVHHFEPDVHSDDAALDFIGTPNDLGLKNKINILDFLPKAIKSNLKRACIRLSEKKSYLDQHRKEFVSEVDDNGLIRSYWQKQAIAAISGLSYIDFFRDISEGCSKVANLISLGGPPTVYEVTLSNVIDLSRDTYSMQPGMWNDIEKFLDIKRNELPLELGGSLTMNPTLLPVTGIKYQTFSKMMDQVLEESNKSSIDELTSEDLLKLSKIQGNLFCKTWSYTAEVAVKENLVLSRLDPGLIRFKQFSSYDKVKSLRVMQALGDVSKELIDEKLEIDPTFSFRPSASLEEQQLKLAMLIKNPSWYASATLQSQGALKLDRMFNVKSPCCAPIPQPGKEMEKGMKTIREAIIESVDDLKSRNVTLEQTYHLLKSMPLLCYVYDLEKQAQFVPGGKRTLFPVSKESFLKGTIVNSSVIGLLQKFFTGETEYSLDHTTLDEEIILIQKYIESLETMERHQQATTIFRILQQVGGFASVFFVPSPRMKGHLSILGLMSLQFSDYHNYFPSQRYEPQRKEIYESLQSKKALTMAQKCSELACFLMRTCESEIHARFVFSNCFIENVPVLDIMNQKGHSFRELAYANALLGTFNTIQAINPKELIWIVAQKRSFPHWTGPFVCYLNFGTRQKPRGLFFVGEDFFIHKVFLLGPYADYPDLKSILIFFCNRMRWYGDLSKHMLIQTFNDGQTMVANLQKYGSSFQVRYSWVGSGLEVSSLSGSLEQPSLAFKEINRTGLVFTIDYKDFTGTVRAFNQRVSNKFHASSQEKIGPFFFNSLWTHIWNSVSLGSKISLEYYLTHCFTKDLFLSKKNVDSLKSMGYDAKSTLEITYTAQMLIDDARDDTMMLNTNLFEPAETWTQSEFNFYLSLAIHCNSSLATWISLQGYLQDLHNNFFLVSEDRINRTLSSHESRFNSERNYFTRLVLKAAQAEDENEKFEEDDFSTPLDEAEIQSLRGSKWADLI